MSELEKQSGPLMSSEIYGILEVIGKKIQAGEFDGQLGGGSPHDWQIRISGTKKIKFSFFSYDRSNSALVFPVLICGPLVPMIGMLTYSIALSFLAFVVGMAMIWLVIHWLGNIFGKDKRYMTGRLTVANESLVMESRCAVGSDGRVWTESGYADLAQLQQMVIERIKMIHSGRGNLPKMKKYLNDSEGA
ncbi:MAG: hypothetical protein KGI60_00450 [Patescibacteria group bacterium]|nr:hypothetical protein [Patescibacteria group bacterium]